MSFKVILWFSIFFLFVSCAHQTSEENVISSTLKSTSNSFDSSTVWTKNLDSNVLSEDCSSVNGISNKLPLSTELFCFSNDYLSKDIIYPRIRNSYSLNTSNLSDSCFSIIDNFLLSLEKGESLEQYFKSSEIYSLVIFDYEYKKIFGEQKIHWHAIGELFYSEGYYQCPVRLFFEEEKNYLGLHTDVMIIVEKNDLSYKIISLDLFNQLGE